MRLLPLIALSLTLAACGTSAEDDVRDALRAYLTAVAAGDARAACKRLTENGKLGVFEFRKIHAGPDHPDEACAEIAAEAKLPGGGAARLRAAAVGEVTVDGDSAGAVVDGVPVTLRRLEGEWLIDVFGFASDVAGGRFVRRE